MRTRANKIRFGVVFSLVCLFCIIRVGHANPQIDLPNPIRLGIRTAAFPIGNITPSGEWGGFCGVFARELGLNLNEEQIDVIPNDIENEYRGEGYPRFDGLLSNRIDVECGPNSKSSLDLPDKKGKPFRKAIDFSNNSFFTTGIRILVKAEVGQRLSGLSPDNLPGELSKLRIGVLPNTTTYMQFKDRKEYYPKYRVIDAQSEKGDARDAALDALENDNIEAFASDAIILQTLLEKGVRGEGSYRKTREPYGDRGYVAFPSKAGEYLPYLPKFCPN
jgi:polar amino acid transport system substrate-binding protein